MLINYLKYLSRKDFNLVVACSGKNSFLLKEYERFAKVYIICFSRLKRFSLGVITDFFKGVIDVVILLYREQIDIVAVNTERAFYLGVVACFFKKGKLVLFIRDYCYNKLLLKSLLPRVSKVFCVSESIKNFYELKAAKVIYVSSDMSERISNVSQHEILKFKQKYGLENKFVVGYAGRLVEWKGIRWLLKAVEKLGAVDAVCVIAGNISDLPKDLAKYTNLTAFKFIGFKDKVEVFYRAIDVFVHPAIEKEPFATTLVEAQMAKVPVIATNLGGNVEIITNTQTGLLIEPRSEEQIVSALLRLHSDNLLRERIIAKAFSEVMKKHFITGEIAFLQDVFKTL